METDEQKINRIEKTLATLIVWLTRELGIEGATQLMRMLNGTSGKGDE